jgi:predicted nucleic acid-binding protein
MTVAYVDTSCLVAIAFRERGATALLRRIEQYDDLLSSNLLEAELRAAYRREGIAGDPELLRAISWIIPERLLSAEIAIVLQAGYVRGADCWHLATALYVADNPGDLVFVTLDERQRATAELLGFQS